MLPTFHVAAVRPVDSPTIATSGAAGTATPSIDFDGTPLAVDTGFIVYDGLSYPELTALFAHLDIETVESCMSFAVTADDERFEWRTAKTCCLRHTCGCCATS